MKIAFIDSVLAHVSSHEVRGSGTYARNLMNSLRDYFPQNEYELVKKFDSSSDINHYLYFEPFFKTLPLQKKGKRVVTVHDLIPLIFPQNFPSGLKGKLNWELQKHSLRESDLIITDSQCSKKDIIRLTGISKDKVSVVYLAPGEDFKKIKTLGKIFKKYNLPEKYILYVGDATWNKNLVRLVRAVINSRLNLVMVGKALTMENVDKKNPWNKELVQVQEISENKKNIIKIGFVPNEDLIEIYNCASVFAMPSLYEGFGLPILEAMACGCPVLTSRQGSIPEITDEAAFFVDPYNMKEIEEGIKKLLQDKGIREKLSIEGLEQVKKFSWKKTALSTLESYKSII